MRLYAWNIGKSKFDTIPEAERTFIIGFSHILNEINVLQKLLYWAAPKEKEPEIFERAHASQASTIAKLLVGKLHEAWRFFNEAYFNRVSNDYDNVLNKEGKEALENLKQYFNRKNNIVFLIRNNFGFHYSVEYIRESLSLPPDTNEWQVILAPNSGNMLYYFADIVANYAMLNSIDQDDHRKAMKRLLKDLTDVSKWLIEFGFAFWDILKEKYFRDTFSRDFAQVVNLEDCPNIDEVEVPFFTEPS